MVISACCGTRILVTDKVTYKSVIDKVTFKSLISRELGQDDMAMFVCL